MCMFLIFYISIGMLESVNLFISDVVLFVDLEPYNGVHLFLVFLS